MPSYGFGRALSSPNPLMVLGQGVMGFGRALYDNDLDKKARGRQAALDQRTLDWRNDDLAYRTQRDAVEDQRHTDATAAASRDKLLSRSLMGLAPVDPVADAGADISEALETTRSYVPTPVPGSLGVGRLLRETAPTYSDGETTFRYDPLMDRGRVQAEEQYARQRADATADREDAQRFQVDLVKLQEALRPKAAPAEPSWQVVQTDKGLVQVNPKTGEARPVQIGGQTVQPKATGAKPSKTAETYERLRQLSAAPRSPQSDLAFLYAFQKLQDDGGVVRGEDIETLRSAATLSDRIESAMQRGQTGLLLTDDQRAGFLRAAEAMAGVRRANIGIHAAGMTPNPYRR